MTQTLAVTKTKGNSEHIARARALNLPISTKHSVEISHYLRYRSIAYAKEFLEDVIAMKKAVPFKRFKRDMGHKPGSIAAGRYPIKAAKEFLTLLNSVESNANHKGLNSSSLKIITLIANKASIPLTGGRHRGGTKRTHLEIVVEEGTAKKLKRNIKKTATKKKPQKASSEQKSKTEKSSVTKEEKKEKESKQDKKEVPVSQEPVLEQPTVPEPSAESSEDLAAEQQPKVEEKTEESVSTPTPAELDSNQEDAKQEALEPEQQTAAVSVAQEKEPVAEEPAVELSSEDLLAQAQKSARESTTTDSSEIQDKDVEQAEKLFEQLQQKGTLRKEE